MTIRGALAGCVGMVLTGLALSLGAGTALAASPQPDLTVAKDVFVPGEQTLFFDDFGDMTPGEAPPHFKARGAAPQLMTGSAVRQLTFTANGSLVPNLKGLPANFTYEVELGLDVPRGVALHFLVLSSRDREAAMLRLDVRADGSAALTLAQKLPKYEMLGKKDLKVDPRQPVALALWLQDSRLRVYVNGDKQIDVNQVSLPAIDKAELLGNVNGTGVSVGFRQVRFAESAPDFSQVITANGRYVSHAIRFDTDSDRLKPDSAAPIRAVAKALEANPALKLTIEGHTDSVGEAAHNLDLSKRRAEAVKAVLVEQFKVDAARLATNGLGAGKPLDTNDTPQGRAQNRRVEFVKQ